MLICSIKLNWLARFDVSRHRLLVLNKPLAKLFMEYLLFSLFDLKGLSLADICDSRVQCVPSSHLRQVTFSPGFWWILPGFVQAFDLSLRAPLKVVIFVRASESKWEQVSAKKHRPDDWMDSGGKASLCKGRTICWLCRGKSRWHRFRGKSAFLEMPCMYYISICVNR